MAKKKGAKAAKATKPAKKTKSAKPAKAAKKSVTENILLPQAHCEDDFCDFDSFDEIFGDDMMDDDTALDFFDQFSHVVEAQSLAAMDLTRIIVDHHDQGSLTAEDIFSLYRRAIAEVCESSPLKSIMDEYLAQ